MDDLLSEEELEILKPFKKFPKTREALELALKINDLNEQIRIDNELDDYVRRPLGERYGNH